MAGYNGFAMSNNAVGAYKDGLVPASKISGVPAELVRQFFRPKEWHHSSIFFNAVDFFAPHEVRVAFGLEPEFDDFETDPAAVAALDQWKQCQKQAPKVLENCHVEWLEWSGTRAHPRATECSAEGCTVAIKGQSATVTTPDGRKFMKRLTTRGFYYYCK